MSDYVAGFLFDKQLKNVALVRKEKPAWQKGRLNGIGGKIEPGETAYQAMRREFNEEAGLDIPDWEQYCTLRGEGWMVHFFWAVGDPTQVKTLTDEEIVVIDSNDMDDLPLMTNLVWLVPMAKTFITGAECVHEFVINEITMC